ncbi:hypothetical protein HZH68_007231 [Vespula germanica]|uniref:Uncharacterized protein n=1 Tax=Vespula germanica TaxID=30212 RepID=A0A834K924_VESGE|nr:hypothetical protein HZH68_007231 [Vespula germanica]
MKTRDGLFFDSSYGSSTEESFPDQTRKERSGVASSSSVPLIRSQALESPTTTTTTTTATATTTVTVTITITITITITVTVTTTTTTATTMSTTTTTTTATTTTTTTATATTTTTRQRNCYTEETCSALERRVTHSPDPLASLWAMSPRFLLRDLTDVVPI